MANWFPSNRENMDVNKVPARGPKEGGNFDVEDGKVSLSLPASRSQRRGARIKLNCSRFLASLRIVEHESQNPRLSLCSYRLQAQTEGDRPPPAITAAESD